MNVHIHSHYNAKMFRRLLSPGQMNMQLKSCPAKVRIRPKPAKGYAEFSSAVAWSPWQPVVKSSPGTLLQLDFKHNVMVLPDPAFSVLLAIGVCFGTIGED
jgi:hypothetical protein